MAKDSVLRTGDALTDAVKALTAVSETPRLDAELLLAFATRRTRSAVIAFHERALDPAAAKLFSALLERRARGEPLAYLTQQREFFSLPLVVSPAVLIPRAETELLVELTLAAIAPAARPAVLDVGTGSGAIALAIKRERGDALVTATDRSAAALAVARRNAAHLALDVRFVESDWLEKLGGEMFDVIASNPPYVRSAEIVGSLTFEPRVALDGGADGLDAYRVLFAAARDHLNAGGALLVEHGAQQRAELVALAAANGWPVAAAHDDLAGRPRVLELARGAP
ncbi:MAG TPA: peptide chain release factor N(5)-glutamine methyltransferase [Gammaproteobacteria bacterium]|nr:peptide chain release factor N(5)-glutamine methyltransferase [Gammaproteobacteria bacterium]